MFITLEGPEGSGKTRQLPELVKFLRAMGYDVLPTREPGGTPIGDQIRAVLSDLSNKTMRPRTEILLFQASRAQLVDQVILPFLRSDGVVVCDRYADSTLAYQGYGYEIDLELLIPLVTFATRGLKPDLTLFLDIPVEEGLLRKAKGGERNRLDTLDLAFYRRVQRGYYRLVQAEPQRWVVIDASRSFEEVQEEIYRVVAQRLGIMLSE